MIKLYFMHFLINVVLFAYYKGGIICFSCSYGFGYEGVEVINPEGGKEDAEEEDQKGRWKQEMLFFLCCSQCLRTFNNGTRYIGSDVTSMVTLPVIIFEPMTMLQKMAEYVNVLCLLQLMEYSYLLDLADKCKDPYLRLVSHHPPMSAGHAENEHFTYDMTSKLKTKFLGNSLEVYPVGNLVPPPTKVNNLIFGRTRVDSPGEMIMTNLTTGDKVVLYFQPCGWFGSGRYEVDGKWNESMSYQPCDTEGEPLQGTELKELSSQMSLFGTLLLLQKMTNFKYTYFAHKIKSFDTAPKNLLASESHLRPDRFALERGDLSKAGAEKSRSLSLSHARITKTLENFLCLQKVQMKLSTTEMKVQLDHEEKKIEDSMNEFKPNSLIFRLAPSVMLVHLEERQRAEKRTREASGHQFTPRWFDLTDGVTVTPWGDLEIYSYNGKYPEHWATVDSSDTNGELDIMSIEFNPWQYGNLSNK
ncbi:hypothetical protein CXB51_007603 [Gossypium anomalum]|uniref:Uncharacterized protein n=1 Tax=Gossypium anomalum TaxID=47600 RepID=A0A8J5ZE28_9ROSI|nr:hypothetical protein CXB51_007603 [Gossypium anomalum]